MKPKELNFYADDLVYTGIIGTGGIGSGRFFVLNGNHTMGREESRSGHFLDANDYCKLHIILHYIRVLLGPSFSVIPVGMVGDDLAGDVLYKEMSETGIIMDRVERIPGKSTLFSFCISYPDGTGGNLTTDNSASEQIDEGFIEKVKPEIQRFGPKGIIMAAPEVPLAARQKLLESGKRNGLFCAASFTSGEIYNAMETGIMANVDLLAINIDEASAVTGSSGNEKDTASLVGSAIRKLRKQNKNIIVSITAGKQGSWCWDGQRLSMFPSIGTKAVSTAGAGDAFFSGILCGLALGLDLSESQQLASLIAGLSVTSPHTIHKGVDRHSLCKFLNESDLKFADSVINLLKD